MAEDWRKHEIDEGVSSSMITSGKSYHKIYAKILKVLAAVVLDSCFHLICSSHRCPSSPQNFLSS